MITVVIRTYNEADNLLKLLKILKHQTIVPEIIVVDSNSTDKTKEYAVIYGAKVVQCIPFTYGKGLNIGANLAENNIICSLSAHCFPLTDNFLLKMYNNFRNRVAGVYARQIPTSTSNILDKRNLYIIFRKQKLSQNLDAFFNNAASMFRKDIWQAIKFNENIGAWEDIVWANAIQKAGYTITYEPNACVYHYHDEPIEKTIERYQKEYQTLKELNLI